MQQQKLPFTNLIQKMQHKRTPKKEFQSSRKKGPKKILKKSKTYPQEMIGERKFSHYETADSGVQIQVRKKERKKARERKREEAAGLCGVDK